MAARVAEQLLGSGRRLVTAESCTGGWMAKACTDLPGSSRWFRGGVVAYTNEAKTGCSGCAADTARGARGGQRSGRSARWRTGRWSGSGASGGRGQRHCRTGRGHAGQAGRARCGSPGRPWRAGEIRTEVSVFSGDRETVRGRPWCAPLEGCARRVNRRHGSAGQVTATVVPRGGCFSRSGRTRLRGGWPAAREWLPAGAGRPQRPDQWHLTLEFLGDVPEARLHDAWTRRDCARRSLRRLPSRLDSTGWSTGAAAGPVPGARKRAPAVAARWCSRSGGELPAARFRAGVTAVQAASDARAPGGAPAVGGRGRAGPLRWPARAFHWCSRSRNPRVGRYGVLADWQHLSRS